jgi:hypothetical protein
MCHSAVFLSRVGTTVKIVKILEVHFCVFYVDY